MRGPQHNIMMLIMLWPPHLFTASNAPGCTFQVLIAALNILFRAGLYCFLEIGNLLVATLLQGFNLPFPF